MEADAAGDLQSFTWHYVGMCVTLTALLLGFAWLAKDIPDVLSELWRLLGDWAAVHDVRRVVDCRPWGLDMVFTIEQDHATTVPAQDSVCSWAAVPGRKWEFGLSLWNGAVALCRHLTEQRGALVAGTFGDGSSVIELGCGQALVAMVVRKLFPGLKNIVATDGSEDVLLGARDNIAANLGSSVPGLHLATLLWEEDEHIERALNFNNGAPYDVVLGADVTYLEDCEPLVSTILQLSHERTEVWLAHEPRRWSTEKLVAALEAGFQSVESFSMQLSEAESGRNEVVPIMMWHCIGKATP